MKKEHKRYLILGFSLLILIFAISFSVGFFMSEEEETAVNVKIEDVPVPTPTPVPTPEPVKPYYLISAEKSKLSMYYVEGDIKKEIKSETIAADIFPADDILSLSEGIKTFSDEEAYSLWENFIS